MHEALEPFRISHGLYIVELHRDAHRRSFQEAMRPGNFSCGGYTGGSLQGPQWRRGDNAHCRGGHKVRSRGARRRSFTKVVLCTDVAESSLTVPDVFLVVDFCLRKVRGGESLFRVEAVVGFVFVFVPCSCTRRNSAQTYYGVKSTQRVPTESLVSRANRQRPGTESLVVVGSRLCSRGILLHSLLAAGLGSLYSLLTFLRSRQGASSWIATLLPFTARGLVFACEVRNRVCPRCSFVVGGARFPSCGVPSETPPSCLQFPKAQWESVRGGHTERRARSSVRGRLLFRSSSRYTTARTRLRVQCTAAKQKHLTNSFMGVLA